MTWNWVGAYVGRMARAFNVHEASLFSRLAQRAANFSGKSTAFLLAIAIVVVWLVCGPIFHYSDTWQLVINTGTTIITFLMVFLIQNTQNRDTRAIQVKLDELIRATEGAHTALLDLEELPDEDLERMCRNYRALAAKARERLEKGKSDTDIPEVEEQEAEEAAKAG